VSERVPWLCLRRAPRYRPTQLRHVCCNAPSDRETWADVVTEPFDSYSLEGWRRLHAVRSSMRPLREDPRVQTEWVKTLYVQTARDDLVRAAIKSTVARNGGGLSQWLAIDGFSALGKTDLMVNFAIRFAGITDGSPARSDEGYLRVPIILVTPPTSKPGGAAILRAICRFVGIDNPKSEEDAMRKLALILPRLGTEVIAIDDGHMCRRAGDRATTLSDFARTLLRLPVTLVVIGVDLDESAFLKRGRGDLYQTTEQLRRRCTKLPLSPLSLPADKPVLDQMIRRFAGRVADAIPGMTFSGLKRGTVRQELVHITSGCHGHIWDALKAATIEIIDRGARDVDEESLLMMVPSTPGGLNVLDWSEREFLGVTTGGRRAGAPLPDDDAGRGAPGLVAGDPRWRHRHEHEQTG
jgi:hypothetical protein